MYVINKMKLVVLLVFILPFVSCEFCNFGNVPVDSSFNITKFLGIWYEIERTTFQWGPSGTWHSSVWNWYLGGDGNTYMAYGGFSKYSKTCSQAQSGLVTGKGGKYMLTAENVYEAALQVRFTDYNIAVVYMCYAVETNGQCLKRKVHVNLLARHKHLTTSERHTLISKLDNVCVKEGDLFKADMGLCVEPTPDPQLIG